MELFERKQVVKTAERTLLAHVHHFSKFQNYDKQECLELAATCGANVVDFVDYSLDDPTAKMLIGKGMAASLKDLVTDQNIDLVLFNTTLSPSQERNLSRLLNCRVIDRVSVILDIFAMRAQTHEGRLQVELAQLQHLSTRLTRGWTHLERQRGGIGLRGPGETQLETDRRLLNIRIKTLKKSLLSVQKRRGLGRNQRQRNNIPCVALVGYTNAGKSSLFNAMCDTDIYATDQLFATLDTTIRKTHLNGVGTCLIIDTVGFIQNLPIDLVTAFRATLEEVANADLLLHVVDVSDKHKHDKIEAVEKTLLEIKANNIPSLRVYNKVDLLDQPFYQKDDSENCAIISAEEKTGLNELNYRIAKALVGDFVIADFSLHENCGAIRAKLFELGEVLSEKQQADGTLHMTLNLSKLVYEELSKHPSIKKTSIHNLYPERRCKEKQTTHLDT